MAKLQKLENMVRSMEEIYPMGTNLFLCEGAQTGSFAWVVFISFGDGKTPIAAFPKKYYDVYTKMKGVDKEIYLAGLIYYFSLTSQKERKMSKKPNEQGFYNVVDQTCYRLFHHPGNEYGYNWNWLDEDFVKPHGNQLP